jgi:hypothetical protein
MTEVCVVNSVIWTENLPNINDLACMQQCNVEKLRIIFKLKKGSFSPVIRIYVGEACNLIGVLLVFCQRGDMQKRISQTTILIFQLSFFK